MTTAVEAGDDALCPYCRALINISDNEDRIITRDWSKYTMKEVVFKPKNMTSHELIDGVRKMYVDFYSTQYTIKSVFRSLRLGMFPFFMVLGRNAIAKINSRRLFHQN